MRMWVNNHMPFSYPCSDVVLVVLLCNVITEDRTRCSRKSSQPRRALGVADVVGACVADRRAAGRAVVAGPAVVGVRVVPTVRTTDARHLGAHSQRKAHSTL